MGGERCTLALRLRGSLWLRGLSGGPLRGYGGPLRAACPANRYAAMAGRYARLVAGRYAARGGWRAATRLWRPGRCAAPRRGHVVVWAPPRVVPLRGTSIPYPSKAFL